MNKKLPILLALIFSCAEIFSQNFRSIGRDELLNKIKGGWAGQTIGVTFGWPSEFVYQGTYIQDYERIRWHDDYVNEAMTVFPGLYDDVYVDLTFVEVFERLGINAPLDSFAVAFAGKQYELWHANQAGRYNLQQGLPAEKAGHWLNNPHADDIDFQIEADFAGLMSPGMPRAATKISDRLGRLMNSGDGLYGGVYVANLYAHAFLHDDVLTVVTEALAAIPPQSKFHRCVSDVIAWYKANPNDWKQTWFEIQKKWSEDTGCPNGVFHPLNIDAKINAAYVVAGLLYGRGDFTRTLEISTRLGQDSDCNPATAAGVLGVMKGYSGIPEYWLTPLKKAEKRSFSFTDLSLEKVYELGFRHALANITDQGGRIDGNTVRIPVQKAKTVPFEENFGGHYPSEIKKIGQTFGENFQLEVEGIGFVIRGYVSRKSPDTPHDVLRAALFVDGKKVEEANFPTDPKKSRTELFWRYRLESGRHRVEIKITDPKKDYQLHAVDCLIYSNKPREGIRHD
ncbi:hypothetical protein GCM10023091_13770 [Ravibacter arvi]|uniref:ADP-ribosylglycohydrolase n=1 Tax=Ravibacter arvi TaxID=2051041 RepID=A0ABP8LV20_9BACT